MLAGEIFRFLMDKAFYSAPRTLDEELTRFERIAGGRTYSIHLTVQYNGLKQPGEMWLSAAFDVRTWGSIGLPTEQLRPRMPFESIEEPRGIWDWVLATKVSRGMQGVYLDERFYPDPVALEGETLIEHNLAEALEALSAPLVGLRALTWYDDRGPGSGIDVHATISSNFPQADNPVTASLYGGQDTAQDQALIRSWGERTASARSVPFRFD
jgi:hypothetical protein